LASFEPASLPFGLANGTLLAGAEEFQKERLGLSRLLQIYEKAGVLKPKDMPDFRAAFRAMRTFDEEMSRLGQESPRPDYVANPDIVPPGPIDLKKILRDGDIILSRGRPEKSIGSTIATIVGDALSDSQFSHAQIVRVSGDGLVRIEALIEDGTKIRSWEDFEKGEKVRYLILRFSDAEIMSNIPQFRTIVKMGDPWFLQMLGVENDRSIEHPGDFEVDPRMTPVLEYRDPVLAHEALLGQAIMHFVFEKLNQGYRIRPSLGNIFVREGIWRLRQLPEWMWRWIPNVRKLENAFPDYISQNQIQIIVSLQNLFKRFFKELNEVDDPKAAMGWNQLNEALEKIFRMNASNVQKYLYFENPDEPASLPAPPIGGELMIRSLLF